MYRTIIQSFPGNKRALQALNKLNNSKPANKSAAPSQKVIDQLIGLYDKGKPALVVEQAQQLVGQYPDAYIIWHLLGAANSKLGEINAALSAFVRVTELNPNYPDGHFNLGVCLNEQGKLNDAERSYRKAISLRPDYHLAHNNLGAILGDRDIEAAMRSFEKAISYRHDFNSAWENGADALEKWNKLDQLENWVTLYFKTSKASSSVMLYLKAKMLWRNKSLEESLELIESIEVGSLPENQRLGFLTLSAQLHDAQGSFDRAFDYFTQRNLLQKHHPEYLACDHEGYIQSVRDQLKELKCKAALGQPSHAEEVLPSSPVFMVGFPRSGTTLLNTILKSHSNIDVIEEKPTVAAAKHTLNMSARFEERTHSIPSNILLKAREAYQTELERHKKKVSSETIYIDKLPLNLISAPLIHQLFPDAKFILSLRHPLDAILSCWMQNFGMNSAMANTLDLDRTVELYCLSMEIFKCYRMKHNLNVHTVRYEDLIETQVDETVAILDFLDLNWQPQMKNYRDAALVGGRINTPSYSQVVQPLYKNSIHRWRNYSKYLEKYLCRIDPWINEFGY